MQTVEVSIPQDIWETFLDRSRVHTDRKSKLVLGVIRNYSKQLRKIRVVKGGRTETVTFNFHEHDFQEIEEVSKKLLTTEEEVIKRAVAFTSTEIQIVGHGGDAKAYSKRNLKYKPTPEPAEPDADVFIQTKFRKADKKKRVVLDAHLPLREWHQFLSEADTIGLPEDALLMAAHLQFESAKVRAFRGKLSDEPAWAEAEIEVTQEELYSFDQAAHSHRVDRDAYLASVVSHFLRTRRNTELAMEAADLQKLKKKKSKPVYLDVKVPRREWNEFLKAALSVGLPPDTLLMTAHKQFDSENGKVFSGKLWARKKLDEVRIPLTEDEYFSLEKAAGEHRVDVDNYVASIVSRWVRTRHLDQISNGGSASIDALIRKHEKTQRRRNGKGKTDRLLLEVELGEYADVDESAKQLAKFIEGLSRLRIAHGGEEFEIEDILPLEPAGELVPSDQH